MGFLLNIMKLRQFFFTFSLVRLLTGGYLDPNTGGMLFQMLAAGFATVSGFVLVFSRRIKLWIVSKRRERREEKTVAESKQTTGDNQITK